MNREQLQPAVEEALRNLERATQLVGSIRDHHLNEQVLSHIAEASSVLQTRLYELRASTGEARWPPEPETYW